MTEDVTEERRGMADTSCGWAPADQEEAPEGPRWGRGGAWMVPPACGQLRLAALRPRRHGQGDGPPDLPRGAGAGRGPRM
ncbi:hypothetical protein [Nocardiopsis sp. NPDC006938]|uniref:hypothetical protein n=1 Tax=Nocardiopsis sp. NPDC006938 TaxID=3364337 RepID=UPI0036C1144F